MSNLYNVEKLIELFEKDRIDIEPEIKKYANLLTYHISLFPRIKHTDILNSERDKLYDEITRCGREEVPIVKTKVVPNFLKDRKYNFKPLPTDYIEVWLSNKNKGQDSVVEPESAQKQYVLSKKDHELYISDNYAFASMIQDKLVIQYSCSGRIFPTSSSPVVRVESYLRKVRSEIREREFLKSKITYLNGLIDVYASGEGDGLPKVIKETDVSQEVFVKISNEEQEHDDKKPYGFQWRGNEDQRKALFNHLREYKYIEDKEQEFESIFSTGIIRGSVQWLGSVIGFAYFFDLVSKDLLGGVDWQTKIATGGHFLNKKGEHFVLSSLSTSLGNVYNKDAKNISDDLRKIQNIVECVVGLKK